ncbi:MAG TPA: CpsD/CapB family tyrosine-protein kinase [Candidatus Dormibacteraeota bacterium]|jgi:protein-tyrosine kinase|nr:CpsD/CapB family tyrosine-protein kinase [Candidatus Dormibacteraeota bacterium]
MSRNFELLQNLGKEVLLDAPAAVAAVDQHRREPVVPQQVESKEPQLKLEPKEREELTKLAQRIFLQPGADSPRVVVFTASESGNGCSSICACAAELLAAQVTGSVCLVDANLRHPGLHEQFAVENHFGLADALQGTEPLLNYARSMSRTNLWLVSCGSSPEAALPLLSSDRMRQRITELRSGVDYVLIDASAMNVSNDATVLAAAADGVVMVLKANSSRRETVRKAVQDMQASHVRVLGAVLNQRTFPIPDAIYNRL